MGRRVRLRALACLLCACLAMAGPGLSGRAAGLAASAPQRLPLSRGVNLGSILDAPGEGAWGESFQDGFPRIIKAAGFDHVRLPVCFSIYASDEPPYPIAPWILERVEHILALCRAEGLAVILDLHNYEELMGESAQGNAPAQKPRYLALWKQIAERFAGQPDTVLFEPMNEPALSAETWNQWIPEVLAVIRQSNPTRWVLLGGCAWENAQALEEIPWPADERVAGTFHFYQPFSFTHQGAEHAAEEGSLGWVGTPWSGTDGEQQPVREEMERAAAWSRRTGRPVHLGEFGVYQAADAASRAAWAGSVARQAEAQGIGWSYWDFCASFGLYDEKTGAFETALLDALMDR